MRIAQLAPLAEAVPPLQYGGTELIVSLLTEGLVALGHEVTLFASADSRTEAKLVSVNSKSLRADESVPQRRWSAYSLRQIHELENRIGQFDIIHNHMGYEALRFLS
ncbi:MAG: glycosyltransferase, partial [Candidatus Obscuribacterales bacterium]|nr:glycosyltransferase [Candidatus Obscuribacterales bacterium]